MELRLNTPPDIITILIGINDHLEEARTITTQEVLQFKIEYGLHLFLEISGKSILETEGIFIEALKY